MRSTHRRLLPPSPDGRRSPRRESRLALEPARPERRSERFHDILLGPEIPPAESRAIRVVNIVVAVAAIVALLPLMALIALAIKLDSRGPVLYRQLRVGLDRRGLDGRNREGPSRERRGPERSDGARAEADGRAASEGRSPISNGPRRTSDLGGKPFVIYKFRTMHLNAERDTGAVWASAKDRRTTGVGRFLRYYRLDEIPQFLNVLKGDMSVVGPRPERPSFVQQLRQELGQYPLRQRVPPGITGWAQVNRPPDRTLDDVRNKLEYDLEYLRRRSLSFDLRIMLRTLPAVLDGEPEES